MRVVVPPVARRHLAHHALAEVLLGYRLLVSGDRTTVGAPSGVVPASILLILHVGLLIVRLCGIFCLARLVDQLKVMVAEHLPVDCVVVNGRADYQLSMIHRHRNLALFMHQIKRFWRFSGAPKPVLCGHLVPLNTFPDVWKGLVSHCIILLEELRRLRIFIFLLVIVFLIVDDAQILHLIDDFFRPPLVEEGQSRILGRGFLALSRREHSRKELLISHLLLSVLRERHPAGGISLCISCLSGGLIVVEIGLIVIEFAQVPRLLQVIQVHVHVQTLLQLLPRNRVHCPIRRFLESLGSR